MPYLFVLGFLLAALVTYLIAPELYASFMAWIANTLSGRPS